MSFLLCQQINFCWSVTDQLWDANFEELKLYNEKHGTFEVTHKVNRKLATFISRLRTAMSHKQNGLVQQDCKFSPLCFSLCDACVMETMVTFQVFL